MILDKKIINKYYYMRLNLMRILISVLIFITLESLTLLNILFTYLFSKNIIKKHLFSKNKIRNFSFYSLGILLFIIIILSFPRFILRNFFTMFFFGEVTYISIFLSIL